MLLPYLNINDCLIRSFKRHREKNRSKCLAWQHSQVGWCCLTLSYCTCNSRWVEERCWNLAQKLLTVIKIIFVMDPIQELAVSINSIYILSWRKFPLTQDNLFSVHKHPHKFNHTIGHLLKFKAWRGFQE